MELVLTPVVGRLKCMVICTSCSTERNWSLFGNKYFSKTRNRLVLERARKLAYIRRNSSSGATGADEEVALSPADLQLEDVRV